MSKTKSISDLALELQKENESLKNLKKYFIKICKAEFGYTPEEIKKLLPKKERIVHSNAPQWGSDSSNGQSPVL